MDGADPDHWSVVAADWAELWGGIAGPAWHAVVEASGVGAGSSVLDVGCGGGDMLHYLDGLGASTSGIDPALGMVELTRKRVPRADVRLGAAQHLPWPDRSFDLVAAINALQFAEDITAALAEMVRVAKPGGHVAVSNWAEANRNDLNTIEDAVMGAFGEETLPDSDLRFSGGLEKLFADCHLNIVATGLLKVSWVAPDDNALVRGVLFGEDLDSIATKAPTVIAVAHRFRTPAGGYRLVNAFRFAVGRTPT